ncbi:GRXC8, partial [Linum grandiflorum]
SIITLSPSFFTSHYSVLARTHLVKHIKDSVFLQYNDGGGGGDDSRQVVREVARSNAVVVFSNSGCCMCTVVKRLLFGLGVGPTIVEIDQIASSEEIQAVLSRLLGSSSSSVPAVFIGGKFLGGVETLMSCHINGSLVPLLKEAGALWL